MRGSSARRDKRTPDWESLEGRRMLAIDVTFAAAAPALTPRTDVNVSNLSGNQTESFVAVNPANPANLIAYSNTGTGNLAWFSTNGGSSWSSVAIPAPANTVASSDRDPNIAFDRNGTAFLAYLADDTAAAGVNHIVVAQSTNGGQAWSSLNVASGVVYHPYLAIGADPLDPTRDNVYVAYRQDVTEESALDSQVHVRASYDGGQTFPTDATINDDSASGQDEASYCALAVGPGGRLYAAWDDSSLAPDHSDIKLDTSADGGKTWGSDMLVGSTGVTYRVGASGHYTIPVAPDQGILAVPSLAVARTGADAGRVYVSYTFVFPGAGATADVAKTDIRLAYADDVLSGSPTWTYRKVNDDTNTVKSQFHGWMSLDPSTGFLYFTWFDTRNSGSANNTAQRYASVSVDGGATIRPNVRISDGTSNESTTNSNRDHSNYGDFNMHAAYGGVLNALWTDNSMQQSNDLFFDRPVLNAQQVTGTGGAGEDTYYVRLDPSGTFVQIYENSPAGASGTPAFTLLKSAMSSLALKPGAGSNTITLDYTNGDPLPAPGLSIDASGGGTKVMVVGKAGANQVKIVGGHANVEMQAGADAQHLSFDVAAGAGVSFETSAHVSVLRLGPGATGELTASAAPGQQKVLVAGALDLDPAARFDLTNNAMVVDYATNTVLPDVRSAIVSGYNAGGTRWGGSQLTSSSAAGDAGAAIGYAEASDVLSPTGGTFCGQSVDGSAVLVAFTRAGDADLSGAVDNADFMRLKAHFGQTPASWSQGDSDYDNAATFADFQRLELNFGTGTPAPVASAGVQSDQVLAPVSATVQRSVNRPVFARKRLARRNSNEVLR
jgi:hypothetical protein